jgi:hypothetical protein
MKKKKLPFPENVVQVISWELSLDGRIVIICSQYRFGDRT